MPDQPDDPIHYDMKIPPEPKDATLHKQEQQQQRGSDEVTQESDQLEDKDRNSRGNPPRSGDRSAR
jgi:hypothetical protein